MKDSLFLLPQTWAADVLFSLDGMGVLHFQQYSKKQINCIVLLYLIFMGVCMGTCWGLELGSTLGEDKG